MMLLLLFLGASLTTSECKGIAVNCGSSADGRALDGRFWAGDHSSSTNLSYIDAQSLQNSVTLYAARKPSKGYVPYLTARVSGSQLTYLIPVTAGATLVRFHFYLTSYLSVVDPGILFFSVKAGNFTLLRNFSALLHAQGHETVVKEFIINLAESQILNLTLTPDAPGSFVFINAFEVVPVPYGLYYPAGAVGGEMVKVLSGQLNNFYEIQNDTVMETVNRLNVGGRYLASAEDKRMYREWSPDENYVRIQLPGALPCNASVNLSFSDVPAFSAPPSVYKTARTMGLNKTMNENYNLTWEFPVDCGFKYFLRLHFCEFQPEITKPGDRVFRIFIANFTAEDEADVISWSGGNGVPTYRDYMVPITKQGNERKRNLSVALGTTDEWRTLYSDSILNGVELFKLDNSGDLAGPNPDPVGSYQSPNRPLPRRDSSSKLRMAVGLGSAGLLFGLCLFCIFLIRRKRGSWTKSCEHPKPNLSSYHCRCFSLAEIKLATNNFDQRSVVGSGGFGKVYKGCIDGEAATLAIKRLNPDSRQGAQEFTTEIELLSQLRHLHLVSLIGYCHDGGEMILVYDYMSRGTLRDHLYKSDKPPLKWKQRLKISIGAAQGLQYLHGGTKQTVIHRDVKTTNILLDEKWLAKLSDFGLSRVGPAGESTIHVTTMIKGSFGYMDPEYVRRQRLTEKSDVYSFGVVLCEVLCGRPPINHAAAEEQVNLATWFRQCHEDGCLDKIVDQNMRDEIVPECLKVFCEVAKSCLLEKGTERPSMKQIVAGLELALQLQEKAHDKGHDEEGAPRNCTSASFSIMSREVFSEIIFPEGR